MKMTGNNQKLSKKEILFSQLNGKLKTLDKLVRDNIRCPLCWEPFAFDALQSGLSVEHVPPIAAARLIKEKPFTTLTCKRCNHTYGSRYHSHLKNFLICQLHQAGKYDKPIRGTITPSDSELVPQKSNIVFTPKELEVVGVPKANAASTTENHISAWESIAKSGASGWRFSISLNYGYIPSIAWSAYLQVAYLMVYILTGCHYAFTAAGRELRTLITQNKVGDLGACIIIPRTVDAVGVGGTPWLAEVTEPHGLRCLWVKLAGNVVILPLHDDSMLSCYKAWQDISEQNHFGLMPRNTHLRLVFRYLQNIAEAQQCLQPASQKSTRA